MKIVEARIDDIHRLYLSHELTPVQLVNVYLARINALDLRTDVAPPFNCIVCVSPSVKEEAAAATDEIERRGIVKPLHGIPIWVKDNIDVEGLPTTGGCLALEEGVAVRDAPLVRSLRSAGAIIMGKVAMTELAIGTSEYSTISVRVGNAVDPRNPAGGSSNGSAVAVSLNFGVVAVGVDDCGSIIDPAAANSCVGLRPTAGLVSRAGLLSCSETETTPGPIGRTVLDVAKMLDALVDPPDAGRYSDALGAHSIQGRRIGVLVTAPPVDFMANVPASITSEFARRLAELERADVIIVRDLTLDGLRWRRQSRFDRYNSQVKSLRGRKSFPRTPRQLFSAEKVAPLVRQLGRNPLLRFGPPVCLPDIHGRAYRRRIRRNQQLFVTLLAHSQVDAVMTVTTLSPSRISTQAQIPHLTVPAGYVEADDELAARGFVAGSKVPWGISILGGPGGERDILAIGHAFEQIFKGRIQPDCAVRDDDVIEEDFDIEAFNQLKKTIAYQCHRTLKLDDEGRRYVHPTGEEFRLLVRHITTTATVSGRPKYREAAPVEI